TAYYALLGLKSHLQQLLKAKRCGEMHEVLTLPSDQPLWEHQRRILAEDFGVTDVMEALEKLPDFLEEAAGDVERSRPKDDERGKQVIPDYAEVHACAANDMVVRQTWQETARLQKEVQELIAHFTRRG